MARFWYAYLGSGDPTLASSYALTEVPPGCLTGSAICAIYAPAGGGTPSAPLSKNIKTYIIAGLVTGIAQPQGSSNYKLYVYLKDF